MTSKFIYCFIYIYIYDLYDNSFLYNFIICAGYE